MRLFLRAAAILAGAPLFTSQAAVARPYTLEDLLRLEVVAGVEGTADGRYLLIQTYGPAASAGRFGDDGWPQPELSRLYRVDTRSNAPAALIYPVTLGRGVLPGPMAPSSDQMLVYELAGLHWRAGVLNVATQRTRWLNLSPELAVYGRTAQWIDDDHLAAIALNPGQAPSRISAGWRTRLQRGASWADTAGGEAPSYRLMGSGRALNLGRPTPAHHFELWDIKVGAGRRLATGDFLDMELSPDGRHAALLEDGAARAPAAGDTVKVGSPSRERRLRLVDLASGRSYPVCPGLDLYSHLLSWSQTTNELLVSGKAETDVVLARVDAGTRRCTILHASNLEPRVAQTSEGIPFVHAGWMGDTPAAYLQRSDARQDRADWYRWTDQGALPLTTDLPAPPARAPGLGPQGLVLATAAEIWQVAPNGQSDRVASGEDVQPFRPGDLSEGARFSENPPRDEDAPLLSGAAAWRPLGGAAISRPKGELLWANAKLAVTGVTTAHGATDLVLASERGRRTILTVNRFLQDVAVPSARSVSYKTASGESAQGWLYLPPTGERRPPLVVIPYPGAVFAREPAATALGQPDFALGVQILLGQGFAVLQPSLPLRQGADNPAEGLTKTILAATDAAVATGAVDPDRLALFGHSYGGYAALVAATQTDRFKAVVAYASPSDLVASWGTINPLFSEHPTFDGVINAQSGWADGGRGHLWSPPWAAPERYIRNSPFFQVNRIKTPILLISADHDFVPLSQSESLFTAFYLLHEDSALLSFSGEGHIVTSPANLRVLFRTVEDWLRASFDDTPLDGLAHHFPEGGISSQ